VTRRINGCFVDSDFFSVCRLEFGSVLTFGQIDLGIVMSSIGLDVNFGVVMSVMMRKVDINVCGGVSVIGYAFFSKVDILSAARTVVTILFTSYVDFFLAKVVAGRRKVGFERRILTFPSDALRSLWQLDLTLDVCSSYSFGVVPVRRREKADGDRDTGVKVQIDDLGCRRTSSRMPFDEPKGRQEGVSCFFWGKEGEEEGV